MPDPTAPTFSHHAPAHRDSVISLADAVARLWPGARVDTSHAGPTATWVQRISLPFGEPDAESVVIITLEWEGWQARAMSPDRDADLGVDHDVIRSTNRGDLISVIHDAFAYIHNCTHAGA